MKNIELRYNPYFTSTNILIDGNALDDEYSILFPVRQYPLQSWLEKRGSWPGISYQLSSLMRGEQFDMSFSGREMDFNDFVHCFEINNCAGLNKPIIYRNSFNQEEFSDRVDHIWNSIVGDIWKKKYRGDITPKTNRLIQEIDMLIEECENIQASMVTEYDIICEGSLDLNNNKILVVNISDVTKVDTNLITQRIIPLMNRCFGTVFFKNQIGELFQVLTTGLLVADENEFDIAVEKYGYAYEKKTKLDIIHKIINALEEIISDKERIKEQFDLCKSDDGADDDEYNLLSDSTLWIQINEAKIKILKDEYRQLTEV